MHTMGMVYWAALIIYADRERHANRSGKLLYPKNQESPRDQRHDANPIRGTCRRLLRHCQSDGKLGE